MRDIELLVPASSLEVLRIAVIYGADAVYIGGEAFGLRAKAKNFSLEEMAEGIAFAHAHQVKVYVTANILAHNYDLDGVREYLTELENMKPDRPDGLIIADPAVFTIAGEVAPHIDRHISTQANNTNYGTFQFWQKLGATRVVTARELSLVRSRRSARIFRMIWRSRRLFTVQCASPIRDEPAFQLFYGKRCKPGEPSTHPCRWKYSVVEEKRPGEYLSVYENERGTYIFNSKDLCMIEHIPDMIDAGIDSFKIEGRMKTALYVATVARTYRKAIDDYLESPEKYQENMPWYLEQIKSCTYRQFTTGFFYGKPSEETQIYDNNTYEKGYTYLGIAGPKNESGMYRLEQRNKFSVGETIEIMKPDGRNIEVTVRAMADEKGEAMESCPHPQQIFYVDLGVEVDEFDILRRREDEAIALD